MPTPHFHDLPDGSSSINHTGEDFWVGTDLIMDERSFSAEPPLPAPIRPAPNPVGYSSQFPPHPSTPPLTPEETAAPIPRVNPAWRAPVRRSPRRRGFSDPDAAIRKDPNAWSLREAVELCKLLEVVVPEAGFHIALTGGLLYKEGRRKDCDLMFYQIRQVEPNYEVLWKYLTVAGVIRSPSYPENGWLVKATYRGKAVDCLFPNAKKKKAGATTPEGYDFRPPPPATPPNLNTAVGSVAYPVPPPLPYDPAELLATQAVERVTEAQGPTIPILYRRSPRASVAYDHTREATSHELAAMEVYLRERREQREPDTRSNAEIIDAAMAAHPFTAEARRRMAVYGGCAIPGDFENPASIPEPPF